MDLTKRNYIRLNFERALHDGHIDVHYRPILRTATEKICGVEALSRWHDPLYGEIAPHDFVPILEDIGKIHLLDHFVLKEAVRNQQERKLHQLPRVPISINLSRCDFALMDPCYILEELTEKYQIPHDYFHIEITETALAQDEAAVAAAIRRFRAHGYKVVLDNFGSGFSSLIALQRYAVDEISIDRIFFEDFTEESRKIIQTIVLMGKSLGIHTIAEGVQNKQHVDFLCSIGCEKIQGDYCCRLTKNDPNENVLTYPGLDSESPLEEQIFSKAGLTNFITDTPVALLSDNGHDVKLLAANPAYRSELHTAGLSTTTEFNRYLHTLPPVIQEKLRRLADRAIRSHQTERIICVGDGQYFHFSLLTLAGVSGFYVHKAELKNLQPDREEHAATRRYDEIVRNILRIYDEVYCVDQMRNRVEIIESDLPSLQPGSHRHGIMHTFIDYADAYIHEEDRARFLAFARRLCPDTAGHDDDGYLAGIFRVQQKNGSYRWKIFDVISFEQEHRPCLLICLHDFVFEKQEHMKELLNTIMASYGLMSPSTQETTALSDSHLWQALLNSSSRKLFWKDREGRFRGASRAFLKFYGIKNVTDLLGKTDEDIGWHIEGGRMHDYEELVMQSGQSVHDLPGYCITRGRQHAISFSKYPVYDGLQIVGLLGEFRDSEEQEATQKLYQKLYVTDDTTGLYNYRELILASVEYADNYRLKGEDYTGIMMSIPEYDRFAQLYGPKVSKVLLTRIRNIVIDAMPKNIVVAHTGSGVFVCFQKGLDTGTLRQHTEAVKETIAAITNIDGFPCTLSLRYALARGSEARTSDEFLHILSARCLASMASYGLSGAFGDSILFDREVFDHADEMVYLTDPLTYELVYMNHALLKSLNLPDDFYYIGHKCYEIVTGSHKPCTDCPQSKLRRDRFHSGSYHNPLTGMDFHRGDILVPWNGRNYHFSIGINLRDIYQRHRQQYNQLRHAVSMNDALNLAIREENPDLGIRKMLAKIGTMIKADHLIVMEEEPNGFYLSATYEWHPDNRESLRPRLHHIPLIDVRPLYDTFRTDPVMRVKDIAAYQRRHPSSLLHTLQIQPPIRAFVAGQLIMGDRSLGCLLVLNPDPEFFETAAILLNTLTHFCSILLRNRDNMKRLHELSTIDQLTSAGNRHALESYLHTKLHPGEHYVIVFSDINGLKKANDTLGHKAGDHLIQAVASVLISIGSREHVFRIGGDEFLMIRPCQDEAGARALLQRIEEKFRAHKVSAALGYVLCQAPFDNIDAIIHEADLRMYTEKKRQHQERKTDS